jgi:hypothetical protein
VLEELDVYSIINNLESVVSQMFHSQSSIITTMHPLLDSDRSFLQGVAAFYKGFVANFCRVGSWNVIMFLTMEQVTFFLHSNRNYD